MLSDAERGVLNRALEKYQPGQSEPILVGGENVLKPALRLCSRAKGHTGRSPTDNGAPLEGAVCHNSLVV